VPVDQVNGVGLYWERTGSGPRLLYCNGSGTTLEDARPVLDLLAAEFDLLAWDYRGLGQSAPLTGPYTMADLAADAAGVLDVAGWATCRMLGVSFGGMVAQEFAVTYPERVEAAGGQDREDPAVAAAYQAQLEARAGHDVWDRLGAITCPALVGYGRYDGIAPAQNSIAIASRIRGAELRGYEGGHGFAFQDPAAFPEFEAFLHA
jgi:3-oxoadipate enol-lactonase